MIQKLTQKFRSLGTALRGIGKVSDTLKFPIFEKKVIPRVFGVQIAGLAMAMSMVAYPTQAFDYTMTQTSQAEKLIPIVITTGAQYSFPLEMTLGMSQGYHSFHPALDLRAPIGTSVYSMDEGVVIEVQKVPFGYGHSVRIAHKGTMSSHYAHLDKVEVESGAQVAKGGKIGTVGMTGRTTGPHLHFEVYVGNKAVNPLSYIGSIR